MVSDEDFLWEFPIGSYVKLSSAVAAILVGGLKYQTQFWKGRNSHKNLLVWNQLLNWNQPLIK
jgi:hypothetical protein